MNILVFAGSLRTDSFNKKFAKEAVRLLKDQGLTAEFVDLKDFSIPLYDGDIETSKGIPDSILQLGNKITKADAVIISTPEYNGSISCVLKNTIDWLSRMKPVPIRDKQMLLLAASPGSLGGVRGLWHSRVPLEVLGAHLFPQMMGLPNADSAFDDQGHLKDEKKKMQLAELLTSFVTYIERLK